jgi:hypothetical protein
LSANAKLAWRAVHGWRPAQSCREIPFDKINGAPEMEELNF